MTNSPSVEQKVVDRSANSGPHPESGGIQFDIDEMSPEEQQLEVTKRIIWEKLVSRLEIGTLDLKET